MPSVIFEFNDSAGKLLAAEVTPRLKLTPYYKPLVSGSKIIPSDPVTVELDENSSATIENIKPNVYTCEVFTNKIESKFDILISNDMTGSVNAADYIINDFSGSKASNAFYLAPVPETTGSFGKKGWIALAPDYVYVYTGTEWARIPVALWS